MSAMKKPVKRLSPRYLSLRFPMPLQLASAQLIPPVKLHNIWQIRDVYSYAGSVTPQSVPDMASEIIV